MLRAVEKNYAYLMRLYFDRYTPDYCRRNNLFYKLDKNKNVVALTRMITDYIQEIIETDYNLIIGTGFHIRSKDAKLEQLLNNYIRSRDFQNMFSLFVLQALITGDTFLKFAIDDDGNPTLTAVRLDNTAIFYESDIDKITAWQLEYDAYLVDGSVAHVKEYYSTDKVEIYVNDKRVKSVDNTYGRMWLIHAILIPSLKYKFLGESEIERAYATVDEINSTYSRIASIENVYAQPRLILSGVKSKDGLREDDNVWSVSENAEVKILEYQGDIIPSMLKKIEKLEDYFRSRFPELVFSNVKESTGYALKLKLLKLVKKIQAFRVNLFTALHEGLSLIALYLGFEPDFEIVTSEIIPPDTFEEIQKYTLLYNLGVVSRRTIAEQLGLDWETERDRMQNEGDLRFAIPNFELPKGKKGNPGKTEQREGEDWR
ncbi:MAG: phage portal protein [Fervidobacterium sp.]